MSLFDRYKVAVLSEAQQFAAQSEQMSSEVTYIYYCYISVNCHISFIFLELPASVTFILFLRLIFSIQ